MNKELTREEAKVAWAQGSRVEASPRLSREWTPIKPHTSHKGQYSADVLLDLSFIFRLAPEPPAKRYRPWTPQEVPVGAWFRVGSQEFHCWIITGWNTAGFFTSNQNLGLITFDEAVSSDRRHSTDNGKTWLPCGVEVES